MHLSLSLVSLQGRKRAQLQVCRDLIPKLYM